jgi:hypothetical protein
MAKLVWMTMPRRVEAQACALGSFHGNYTFANEGYQVDGSGSLSLTATAGRLIADGAGHVSASLTPSVNGSASRRQGSGTYTVNADCSGTLTYTDSVNHSTSNYDIYINANNVQFVSTDNGAISSGPFHGNFRAFPGSVIELAPPCAELPSPAA